MSVSAEQLLVRTHGADPVPSGGRLYTGSAQARLGDVAPSGRARLDALARWIQDVSYADMSDAGVVELAVWVIRRMRIRVVRFPRLGERFELSTVVSGLGPMWAERCTTIMPEAGGDADVEAVTLWVHLDPGGQRPTPLLQAELDAFAPSAAGRRVSARLRHPKPLGRVGKTQWRFRQTDCDLAGHVNNCAYFEALEEELLSPRRTEPDRIDVEVEFRTPAQPGNKLILRAGRHRWIVDEDEIHASMLIGT